VEGIVVFLGFGRCDSRRAGSRGLLVHALPERVLGLLRRTLDRRWAVHSRCFRGGRNLHARRGCRLVRRDERRLIVIVAAVVVTDRLKLSSQLAFLFFSSLDLSALSSESGFLLCRVLLRGRTTLLLFCSLQLTSFDFLFESTEGSLLLFALLLQFAFLPSFLVPSE
jgi:hypothetical protein